MACEKVLCSLSHLFSFNTDPLKLWVEILIIGPKESERINEQNQPVQLHRLSETD